MQLIKSFISFFLIMIERLKGKKIVIDVSIPNNVVGHLIGYSIHGYEMQIFCKKKHYRRKYDKWFIPNDDHAAYEVFSIVSNDAPDSLKKACKLELVIPRLLAEPVSESMQRQAVVDAYLDILAQTIQKTNNSPDGLVYNDKRCAVDGVVNFERRNNAGVL